MVPPRAGSCLHVMVTLIPDPSWKSTFRRKEGMGVVEVAASKRKYEYLETKVTKDNTKMKQMKI